MFFFVSGIFFKEYRNRGLLIRLINLFLNRITPVFFFNILGLIFFIITSILLKI